MSRTIDATLNAARIITFVNHTSHPSRIAAALHRNCRAINLCSRRPNMSTPTAGLGRSAAARANGSPKSEPSDIPIPAAAYLSAEKAARIDAELMGDIYGFTLDQLMELAGVAVAYAIADFAPSRDTASICVVCGPGNNGGDGLVAARHLKMFGYDVCVWYPKAIKRAPFEGLVKQLHAMGVSFVDGIADDVSLVVDAIFGFSFKGGNVREPFARVLESVNACQADVVAVDVPSGWDVDQGAIGDWVKIRKPDCVISLTGPKQCMKESDHSRSVVHYVGGRFVPAILERDIGFTVVNYSGIDAIVRIA